METGRSLNRRQDDRYLIDEIPLEGIGTIIEISKNGLKVKKAPDFVPEDPKDPTLTFPLFGQGNKGNHSLAGQNLSGVAISHPF